MTRRTFYLLSLIAIVLVAGGVSYFASAHPDGLEFVAAQLGFSEDARESATTGSPLADYQVRGVNSAPLSGGLAGLVGAGLVGALMFGMMLLLQRRRSAASE